MKKWPNPKNLFSFKPPLSSQKAALGLGENHLAGEPADGPVKDVDVEARWQKIKFDNAIRISIAIPTYIASAVLWVQHAIPTLLPMTIVFAVYGAAQLLLNWYFMGSKYGRKFDFIFASFDTVSMSLAIFYTGATESPLYFLYFIPLVVHAFHRDWPLVLFSGFGGVVCYAAAILSSLSSPSPAMLTNLGARLFFMLLTVSVACMALNLLRKKEEADERRILRLKTLTLIARELHRLASFEDLSEVLTKIIRLINEGLGHGVKAWTRFMLVQQDSSLMKAFDDPDAPRQDLKQEISTDSCSAMKNNSSFVLVDAKTETECRTECFSFGSHVCVPVSGTENETFGVLFSASPFQNVFSDDEFQFLEFVARSLGLSVQRLHRMQELRQSVEMNSCVLAATIASARSPDETFAAVLDGVMTILKAEKSTLALWDADVMLLKTVKAAGPCMLEERDLAFHLGEGAPGKALEDGRSVRAGGAPESLLGRKETYGIKSLLAVPLNTIKGEPLGVICAAHTEAVKSFSETDKQVAETYAVRAALAIENALMHKAERARSFKPSDLNQPEAKKAA